jgi:polyisoprenoid-binding protein YceI
MKTSRPVHGARATLVGLLAGLLLAAAMAGPARAEPRTYQIDPDHFSIAFSVRHIGFADTIGLFLKGSGSFVYDEQTRALSSGRVVVKADSVFTNHGARDKHVRDSDFLDAKAHPEIVFEATGFEPGADGSGTLSGRLTLLGQTHPVTLDVRLNKAGDYPFGHRKHTLGISASTTIKRSQWGMDYGVDRGMVGDEVKLNFEIEALRD